jgi:hypothetical protein
MTEKIKCNFGEAFELIHMAVSIVETEAAEFLLEDEKAKVFQILTEAFVDMKKHLERIDPIIRRAMHPESN